MAFRLDFGSLRPAKRLGDGRLRVDGLLTRTGVFRYKNSDGTERREYRPAEEVFNKDSLASFEMVPVTDDHPPVSVDANNARKFAVGSVGESVRQDGDFVAAGLVVYDAGTVAKMNAGKVQLSCGYTVDLDDTPGVTPDGELYDAKQTNIRGNHVAIVDIARAGEAARVRMDAADGADTAVMSDPAPTPPDCSECAARQARIDALMPLADCYLDTLRSL
jgi:hypothetical protein